MAGNTGGWSRRGWECNHGQEVEQLREKRSGSGRKKHLFPFASTVQYVICLLLQHSPLCIFWLYKEKTEIICCAILFEAGLSGTSVNVITVQTESFNGQNHFGTANNRR